MADQDTTCLSRLPLSTAFIKCAGTTSDGTESNVTGTSFFYVASGPEVRSSISQVRITSQGFFTHVEKFPDNTEPARFNSTVDPEHHFSRVVKGENRLFLVTNRHVVYGLGAFGDRDIQVGFCLKFYHNDRREYTSEWVVNYLHDLVVFDKPELGDLVAIDMTDIIAAEEEKRAKKLLYFAFTKQSLMMQADFNELTVYEDVAMVGYPGGVFDHVNNMPLVRGGKTASIPRLNYQGSPQFVIDCACMPGSSGSPVLLITKPVPVVERKQLGYLKPVEITKNHEGESPEDEAGREHSLACESSMTSFVDDVDFLGIPHVYFLGVMYDGPLKDVNGRIVDSAAVATETHRAVLRMEMNLGYVIKATQVTLLVEPNSAV